MAAFLTERSGLCYFQRRLPQRALNDYLHHLSPYLSPYLSSLPALALFVGFLQYVISLVSFLSGHILLVFSNHTCCLLTCAIILSAGLSISVVLKSP